MPSLNGLGWVNTCSEPGSTMTYSGWEFCSKIDNLKVGHKLPTFLILLPLDLETSVLGSFVVVYIRQKPALHRRWGFCGCWDLPNVFFCLAAIDAAMAGKVDQHGLAGFHGHKKSFVIIFGNNWCCWHIFDTIGIWLWSRDLTCCEEKL